MLNKHLLIGASLALALGSGGALAGVSAGEAAQLKSSLTPLGAEKAGNAAGSIPAWTGGITQAPAGYKPGQHHPDPFAADKPLFTIDKANLEQYREHLTPGQLALFKTYPDSFRMPVYPSRRSGSAPQWLYDNTFANATSARLLDGGNGFADAYGGVPFPIPKSGVEALWNHVARYRGTYVVRRASEVAVQRNGSYSLVTSQQEALFKYYLKGGSFADLNNLMFYYLSFTKSPARLAGGAVLVHETLDQVKEPRQAWGYNAGQRRVRRAPNLAYDTPIAAADGLRTADDTDMFNGAPDRYDWKLLGKKEIYIPYNNYKVSSPEVKYEELLKPGHLDPQYTRYELHRVWVVAVHLERAGRVPRPAGASLPRAEPGQRGAGYHRLHPGDTGRLLLQALGPAPPRHPLIAPLAGADRFPPGRRAAPIPRYRRLTRLTKDNVASIVSVAKRWLYNAHHEPLITTTGTVSMREPMTWRTSPGQSADALRHPAIPSRSPLASRALSFLGALSLLTFAATPVLAESTPTAAPPQFAVESPKAASSLLLSVAHAGKRLVAVGDRGHILLSDDDGKTWTQAKVPTRQLLTSVFFVNERKGWAVGHDAQILVSDDAGSTWTRQFEDLGREAPLLDIWFADEQHGLAVGAYGALLETRDGGQHWEDVSERLDNEDQFHLNAIAAVKDNGLLVVGEAGSLFRSKDWGATWEKLEGPYEGSLFGAIGTADAGGVLVYGLRGHLFRSADFGDSWEEIPLKAASGDLEFGLSDGALLADGRIVVVGHGGSVLESTDGGRSFSVFNRPDRLSLAGVSATGDGHLILVGQGGVHLAAANGAALEQPQ